MDPTDSAFPDFQPAVLAGKRRMDRVFAPLCGLAAFGYALLLLSRALPSGAPAELTAGALGLPAQAPSFHVLWHALTWLAALLPFGSMPLKLSVLDAGCTALSAALLYQVVVELMMHRLIPHGTRFDRLKVRAIQIGGIVSALAYATSLPVVLSATCASLRALELVPVTLSMLLFLKYLDGARVSHLLAAATVCGLGMGESQSSIIAFMVLCVWGIVALWHQERSSLPMLAFAGLALLLAMLVYPGLAYLAGLPGGGPGALLLMQWQSLVQDYATRTGLFLVALSLFPLILTLATLRQTLNYGAEYESLLTNLALSIAAVLVLANVFPSFSFYALTSPEPVVLPSFLAALTAGFVSAFWWVLGFSLHAPRESADEFDQRESADGSLRIAKGMGYGGAITFGAVLIVSAGLTVNTLRQRPERFAQQLAETMFRDLGARSWLFGTTPANTTLAILARENHRPLYILPLIADRFWTTQRQDQVRRAVMHDTTFDGLDRHQLLESLNLGPDVFLRTWLLTDLQAVNKLAIAGPPRLWASCGLSAVPATYFFTGALRSTPPAPGLVTQLRIAADERQPVVDDRQVDRALATMSEWSEQARSSSAAYAAALWRSLGDTNAAAAASLQCKGSAILPVPQRLLLAAPLSWLWEATLPAGRLEQRDILHVIRQAESLRSEDADDDLAARHGAAMASRPTRNPTTTADVYLLARISADQAHMDETFSWLSRLEQEMPDAVGLQALHAEACLAVTGSVSQAEVVLQKLTTDAPRDMWARHLLAMAELLGGRLDKVERDLLPAMTQAAGSADNDFVRLTRALALCVHGGVSNQRSARDLFVQVADANPDLLVAREWALRLDVQLDDEPAIRRDARVLADCDENHPQANYVLAQLAMRAMQLAEAERLFSRSLAGAMTPQAIVGRARLCYQRRLYADALQLARKATNEYPAYPEAWMILADVLDRMGKPSEAEVIRSRALECTNAPPAS